MPLANRVSGFNRARKWKTFLDLVNPGPETTILDVGFSDEEYHPDDNYIEKHYPHPERITALGIDKPAQFPERYPLVKVVMYDGKVFPFADKEFEVGWSNAVIEHVGTREEQLHFLKEIKRVSKRAFVTTPNRRFPIEVHTRTPLLHFLPKKVFDAYLRLIGKAWATGDYMNLLAIGDIKRLLRLAGIAEYEITANKLLGFTVDYVITFDCVEDKV